MLLACDPLIKPQRQCCVRVPQTCSGVRLCSARLSIGREGRACRHVRLRPHAGVEQHLLHEAQRLLAPPRLRPRAVHPRHKVRLQAGAARHTRGCQPPPSGTSNVQSNCQLVYSGQLPNGTPRGFYGADKHLRLYRHACYQPMKHQQRQALARLTHSGHVRAPVWRLEHVVRYQVHRPRAFAYPGDEQPGQQHAARHQRDLQASSCVYNLLLGQSCVINTIWSCGGQSSRPDCTCRRQGW